MSEEKAQRRRGDTSSRTGKGGVTERVTIAALTAIVTGAWIAVLFVPVSTQIQVGVQAAMMLVLGRYFGLSIVKKGNNGGDNA